MANDPFYIRVLEKLGVNVTRLRWWAYRRSRRRGGATLPAALHWLTYRHKICPRCGAVCDRSARECASCGRKLPSMIAYRAGRLVKSLTPEEAPVVVNLFLAGMVLFFAAQLALDGFSIGTLMSPSFEALYVLGAWSPAAAVADQQYWRFLSFAFLHGGIIHIGFNGFALSQIGPIVESRAGRARTVVLITVTQLGAGIASYLWMNMTNGNPNQPTVGASGWLFGLIGWGIVHFHMMGSAGKSIRDHLIGWALFVLVIGFMMSGRVNNAAHIGGMLAGMAFALIPEERRAGGAEEKAWNAAAWICAALWALTVVFMIRFTAITWPEIANR